MEDMNNQFTFQLRLMKWLCQHIRHLYKMYVSLNLGANNMWNCRFIYMRLMRKEFVKKIFSFHEYTINNNCLTNTFFLTFLYLIGNHKLTTKIKCHENFIHQQNIDSHKRKSCGIINKNNHHYHRWCKLKSCLL